MFALGSLVLNGTPRIAVGFGDKASPKVILQARDSGLDIVELRIDQFSSFDPKYVLKEIAKFKGFPTIATIRLEKEGGSWVLPETDRLSLFKTVLPAVDAVDIELRAKEILTEVIEAAHGAKKLAFVSYHNLETTPSINALQDLADEAKSCGADIVKIATFAKDKQDIRKMASFTIANADKNLITICMGAEGLVSRFFFPALGSLMTFAYVGKPTAPGQLDFLTTFERLRQFYPAFNQEKIISLKLVENY